MDGAAYEHAALAFIGSLGIGRAHLYRLLIIWVPPRSDLSRSGSAGEKITSASPGSGAANVRRRRQCRWRQLAASRARACATADLQRRASDCSMRA